MSSLIKWKDRKMENKDMEEYRRLLQDLENKAQDQYDKTVILLSTGALGVSFTFIKDIVDFDSVIVLQFLIGAWISWGLSTAAVLFSFYTSRTALRKAIEALDEDKENDHNTHDRLTTVLNALSGTFFLLGLVFMIVFVKNNLGG